MWRTWLTTGIGALAILAGGCMSKPLLENPVFIRPEPGIAVDNPVFIPQGPPAYGLVFENVLDVIDDYFEIAYANRYDGRIETFPRVSPGFEQPWRPGSPDCYQRLEATLQTIRRRAEVLIRPADDGGFFIQVSVFKELEDLPRPVRATAGAAAFRSDNTVDRQFEVIDPTFFESHWIPLGRDPHLEHLILQRFKKCM
jgi:hypothetical protein